MNIVHEEPANQLSTADYFSTVSQIHGSPIDLFVDSVLRIQNLCVDPKSFEPELSQVMMLAIVSAVESYVRMLVRSIVNVDPLAQEAAHKHSITFGAAIHYDRELLPEALMEGTSLASARNIAGVLIRFVGLRKNRTEKTVAKYGSEFKKICELRHCIVHRFGRLGSQNAMGLGIRQHKEHLEKPVALSYGQIQLVIGTCDKFVRALNNFCYKHVIERTHYLGGVDWTGDLRRDKSRFGAYYEIFASQKHKPRSPSLQQMYAVFRDDVLSQTQDEGSWMGS